MSEDKRMSEEEHDKFLIDYAGQTAMTRQQAGVSAEAVGKFRKKPVVIEAMLWTGEDNECGIQAAVKFCQPLPHAPDDPHIHTGLGYTPPDGKLYIPTLEGTMCANPGDWIIKGVKGEFYPCKPDIFEATYEPALATATPEQAEEYTKEMIEAMEERSKQSKAVICEVCGEYTYDCKGHAAPPEQAAPRILALCNEHLTGRHYDDAEDAVRNLIQALVTMKGNEADALAEAKKQGVSDEELEMLPKLYRWQKESLAAFRAKFGVESNCQALDAIDKLLEQPQAASAGTQSRSVQRRIALQKGEPMPTFGAASDGALTAEQVRLAAIGACFHGIYDWVAMANRLNALLAAHDQKVRAEVLEEAMLEEMAMYIALRLPEGLPLRGDRNEAKHVILRLMRAAAPAASKPEAAHE